TAYPMPTGYMNNQIAMKTAIAADNSGNTWVGFRYNIGLGKFDGTNWTMYDTTNTPMTTANITALGTQIGGITWVASSLTNNSGELFSYNGTTWTAYSNSINSAYTNAIAVNNANGNVWVGTKSGLYKFNGTTWTIYTVANSGLASDTILSLAINPSGNLLAGTQRGLSIQNGNSWTNYSSVNIGFPSNVIQAVYSDATNGIWLSAGGMVGRFALPYFEPMDSIMTSSVRVYPDNCLSISRGPHGGVIFSGWDGSLVEVSSNRPKFYYVGISRISFLVYNPVNGKTWIVNRFSTGIGLPLFAFDGNNYVDHLGEGMNGLTAYNCRYLDVNNVRTSILNRGDNNWDLTGASYEVPKGSGANTIFASSLWIGGLDTAGTLHQAAMTYRQTGMDFSPGPLDTTNGTTDSTTAVQYDYIWKITKLKIQEFQYNWSIGAVQSGNYEPDHDILTWPAQGNGNYTRNMAPFMDMDGNGVYNPLTGGDYPVIKGDEMLYCIYNDNLIAHTETGSIPLKVEIHESAYAYFCGAVADSQKVINNTTYYDYEIINRSNQNYNSVYLGMWQDADIGYFDDDYVGCVSHDNFSFASNGDVNDGSSAQPTIGTYGAHPPIQSLAVLDGPRAVPMDGIDNNNNGTIDEIGEKNLMTGFFYYNNDFTVIGNPEHADDYYLYMSGKWKDSTNMTIGGNGYGGITPTRFMFDGLPYDTSAWTEVSANNTPGDRRGITSCGPFNLNAGQEVHLLYADVFSRDTTAGPPDSLYYDQAVNDVRRVRNWYQYNSTPSCVQWGVGVNEAQQNNSLLFSLYPNPASDLLTIEYKPQSKNARYEVYDLTGRIVESEKLIPSGQTVISVQDFSSGIYLVRVIDNDKISAKKFIRE
ncbi:MAG TPA: T9SS type A sorting domain-containing protein, partial [Bacteroidia bacterium]|nr:T9SS type A sorting domain-containing protein [Bacteroidia bacterium]